MNTGMSSRGVRTSDPRIRHSTIRRAVPRRGEPTERDRLFHAASLWVAVIILAGLAVAVVRPAPVLPPHRQRL